MANLAERVGNFGLAVVAGAALGSGIFNGLLRDLPNAEPRCTAADMTQSDYRSESPAAERMNRLGGALVILAAEACTSPSGNERTTMKDIGQGAMQVALVRNVPAEAGRSNGGTYLMQVTALKTPDGKLRPDSVTDLVVQVQAKMPAGSDPSRVANYSVRAQCEGGEWKAEAWGAVDEYSLPELKGGKVSVTDSITISNVVMDVMDAEREGTPIYGPAI